MVGVGGWPVVGGDDFVLVVGEVRLAVVEVVGFFADVAALEFVDGASS